MGNTLGVISDDDLLDMPERVGYNILNFTFDGQRLRDREINSTNLPVIREKPNIDKFKSSDMYTQISASSSLAKRKPEQRWNLMQALQQREIGTASPDSYSFSPTQQRYFSNMYIPNQKSMRLMSLDAKVFISKFNRSGSKLLTACQDGYIRIYDGSKGTYHLLNRIHARDVQWSIIDADFSPDGQHFAYSTWTRSFYIMPVSGSNDDCQWIDAQDGPVSRVAIFSLRYSPSGDKIIGGSNNATVIVGDVATRTTQMLRTHRMPVTDVNAVSFLTDQNPSLIIAGCDDGMLKVFDIRCSCQNHNLSKSVVSFIGHYDGITYIDSRNDGYYFLTNSKDQSIKIWDMRRPSDLRLRGSSRQHQLSMANWDYRWDRVPREFYNPNKPLDGDSSVMTYRGHRVSKTLLRAKFSPLEQTGQRFIYTGCSTGRIIIYDVLTGNIREAIEGHHNVIRDLDWHPVRSEIVSSSWDSHVHLNSYNRNMEKRSSSERPLRRSRRLANRNSTPD